VGVLSGVHTAHNIVRRRTMSYDVVRCHWNWTDWFNGGVHIPHDVARYRNDTDAQIEVIRYDTIR